MNRFIDKRGECHGLKGESIREAIKELRQHRGWWYVSIEARELLTDIEGALQLANCIALTPEDELKASEDTPAQLIYQCRPLFKDLYVDVTKEEYERLKQMGQSARLRTIEFTDGVYRQPVPEPLPEDDISVGLDRYTDLPKIIANANEEVAGVVASDFPRLPEQSGGPVVPEAIKPENALDFACRLTEALKADKKARKAEKKRRIVDAIVGMW